MLLLKTLSLRPARPSVKSAVEVFHTVKVFHAMEAFHAVEAFHEVQAFMKSRLSCSRSYYRIEQATNCTDFIQLTNSVAPTVLLAFGPERLAKIGS